jgi:hypothetical protein
MDRPIIVGVADGPHNADSEKKLSKVDLVLFMDWPKHFEPHRIGGPVLPSNWRFSPLVVMQDTVGLRRLTGTNVAWGSDGSELAKLVSTMQIGAGKIVVITGAGDGSASAAAKKLGATVHQASDGSLLRLASFMGKVSLLDQPKPVTQKKVTKPKAEPKKAAVKKVEAKKVKPEPEATPEVKVETPDDNK